MKTILTGLALMGLGAVAYRYRSEIAHEVEDALPSTKSLKRVANNAVKAVTSRGKDSYSSSDAYSGVKESA